MKILMTTVAIILTAFQFSIAQISWVNLEGPYGTGIGAILSLENDVILAGSSAGMTYTGSGLYRSADNGTTWEKITSGIDEDAIVNKLYSFSGNIFCHIENQNIKKSTDNGLTWNETTGLSMNAENMTSTSNGYLYSFGFINAVRSTDGGNTWVAFSNINSEITGAYGAATDSKNNVFILPDQKGVYKSTDFGATWTQKKSGLSDLNCRAIFIDSHDNIFVGAWSDGIFLSTDGGETFNKINSNLPVNTGHPKARCFAENISTGSIYLATPFNGLYKTNDLGVSWTDFNDKLKCKWINDFIISPDGTMWTASDMGLVSSNDGGENWSQAAIKGTPKMIYEFSKTDDAVYTGTGDGGIYKSIDHGDNWTEVLPPASLPQSFILGFLVMPGGDYFYSRNQDGFFKVTNNNTEFHKYSQFGSDIPETFLSFNNAIYAGFRASGIYVSTDMGASWTKETGSIEGQSIFSMAVNPNGDLFAGTNRKGLFRKKTGGDWEKLDIDETLFFSAAIVNNIGELIIGVADGGVYKSNDNGDSFTIINDTLKVISMDISPNGQIFIGTDSDTYYSPDNGNTWQHPSEGYNGIYSRAMTIDKDGYVYAGTMTGGINRTKIDISNVADKTNPDIIDFYPNPASDYIIISSEMSDSQILIYDILGNNVNEFKMDGSNNSIDISMLRPGVYNIITSKNGYCRQFGRFIKILD